MSDAIAVDIHLADIVKEKSGCFATGGAPSMSRFTMAPFPLCS